MTTEVVHLVFESAVSANEIINYTLLYMDKQLYVHAYSANSKNKLHDHLSDTLYWSSL